MKPLAAGVSTEEGDDEACRAARVEAALRGVEDSLLEDVENMEERVCSASLQVKVC